MFNEIYAFRSLNAEQNRSTTSGTHETIALYSTNNQWQQFENCLQANPPVSIDLYPNNQSAQLANINENSITVAKKHQTFADSEMKINFVF